MTRLVQIADIHFGSEDQTAIKSATKVIQTQKPDGLILCGDLTQKGRREEFDAAFAWLESLNVPYVSVPGNHDTPYYNLFARATTPFERFGTLFGESEPVETFKSVSVIGLNTARGWQVRRNWAEGRVNLNELASKLKKAEEMDEGPVLMTCHHPFRGPPNAPLQTRTVNGRKASELLCRSKVNILLSGHVHTPSADIWETGEGRYLSLTAGTLSTRRRQWPCSFNILDFGSDELSVSRFDQLSDGMDHTVFGRWQISTLEPKPI